MSTQAATFIDADRGSPEHNGTETNDPFFSLDDETRLRLVVEIVREMSQQTDPKQMVRVYAARMAKLFPSDRRISLSRRELVKPAYRITRYSEWTVEIDPWKEKQLLPLLSGGILAELIWGDEPRIINDFQVDPGDPAAAYLAGQRSLVAVPLYDEGVALNMVVITSARPNAFPKSSFAERVWLSNLFGRATHHLVLAEQLKEAYELVDREMQIIAGIQRSLLPAQLPKIPTMDLAAFYQTSHRAGGDYYDFFPLPGGQWGILIADVSGHGAHAAVLMAITHTIAHTYPGSATPPEELLNYVNRHLTGRYTSDSQAFVTAFYGIYDPATRTLQYASAGHNPPRLKSCSDGAVSSLDGAQALPLGITPDISYARWSCALKPGDQIVFYTDGITEASNAEGEMFGIRRLDEALTLCPIRASNVLDNVLEAVNRFMAGQPALDDQTMVVATIS
jgi:sigma-B regulation protein RsbU (phosphoserine phosphatase)